jgi:hypothetical protein
MRKVGKWGMKKVGKYNFLATDVLTRDAACVSLRERRLYKPNSI